MYEIGEDVTQSYSNAMVWYTKAAGQGNASAQNSIGVLYRDGKGVPRDFSDAREWFFRATDQGHAAVQFNLGMMYRQDNGRPKALEWFMKAAEQGYTVAHSLLARCTMSVMLFQGIYQKPWSGI